MSMNRSQFLARSGAVAAGAALGGLFAKVGPAGAFPAGGYGPLLADPAGVVELPAGFTYKVLATSNGVGPFPATQLGLRAPAENAGPVPSSQDGMGSVYDPATGRTYLVVNSEKGAGSTSGNVPKTFRGSPVPTWDAGAGAAGGCTTIVLDADMNVIEHVPSIAGTIRNCAGGMTPWGTWLTCEEDVTGSNGTTFLQNHGYLFEVDPRTNLTSAVAYKAMGRASHEAVAIDPTNSDAYITEDAGGSVVFKFVPTDKSQTFGSLGNGGQLFAMKVPGIANFGDMATVGQTISGVTWVPCPVDPDRTNLRNAWNSADVTRGSKMEGVWWIDGTLWFVSSFSTAGAVAHSGQVFQYDPVAGTLKLIAWIPNGGQTVQLSDGTTTQSHLIRDPDNIAATPYGGAIWSQDGGDNQYLVCVDPLGNFFPVAKNPAGGEWAGAHFSHDGKWLFASQQGRAVTLAITGPWAGGPDPVVPEVPYGVMLPVAGAATVAGLLALRNRRMGEIAGAS